MSGGYVVTMQRSPTITDAEARVRLGRVYAILIALARRKEHEATDDETLAGEGKISQLTEKG